MQVKVSYYDHPKKGRMFTAETIACNPDVRTFARGRTIRAALDSLFSRQELPDYVRKYQGQVTARFAEYTDRVWVETGSLPYDVALIPPPFD